LEALAKLDAAATTARQRQRQKSKDRIIIRKVVE
jgi:hypothetical protein